LTSTSYNAHFWCPENLYNFLSEPFTRLRTTAGLGLISSALIVHQLLRSDLCCSWILLITCKYAKR